MYLQLIKWQYKCITKLHALEQQNNFNRLLINNYLLTCMNTKMVSIYGIQCKFVYHLLLWYVHNRITASAVFGQHIF